MDKVTRNAIERATQRARGLLEADFTEQLEGTFDVLRSGFIVPSGGAHLPQRQKLIRAKVVAAIEYKRAAGTNAREAVVEYVRDAAFTVLNRFVALKMLEARGFVQQCVTKGDQSSGYGEFCGLAPGVALLLDGAGYQLYTECLFDDLATEIKVLFDRRDPASALWPRRATFEELLAVLNDQELAGVWGEDETIGWVYQYFNSTEERRQLRDESPAPRDAHELAVRNQFFTPRYVVEFLADNTLGRLWFEMRGGKTSLAARCRYLVIQPDEKGSCVRPLKDPRDLKVLDPAVGSGHFLLYVFELLLVCYEEAWADDRGPVSEVTGRTIREDYATIDDLRRAVPLLIVERNLHGVDIDLRCVQVAAFALWLRAQRAYRDSGVARADRPRLRKTNIVLAEPVGGGTELRAQLVHTLGPELGPLFLALADRMEKARDAGSLLGLEDLVQTLVRSRVGTSGPLYVVEDHATWVVAESRLFEAVEDLAARGTRDEVIARLFADDAARCVAFLQLSRQRFDVVLMNPPFGDGPASCAELFEDQYPNTQCDLYAMFIEKGLRWLVPGGRLGVISNRTWLGLPTLEGLRTRVLGPLGAVVVGADLGSFVLEAQVETAAIVIERGAPDEYVAPWVRLMRTKAKDGVLLAAVTAVRSGQSHPALSFSSQKRFRALPASTFAYWMSDRLMASFAPERSIEQKAANVRQGMATADDFRFVRLAWEVDPAKVDLGNDWAPFAKGGEYSPFFDDVHLVVRWERDGHEIAAFSKAYIRNPQFYGRPGVTWPLRTTSPFGPRVLPPGCAFGHKGPAALVRPTASVNPFLLLGVLASRPMRLLLSSRLGAADDAPGSAAKSYEVGLVASLPWPDLTPSAAKRIVDAARECVELVRARRAGNDETASGFRRPELLEHGPDISLQSLVEATIRRDEERLCRVAELTAEIDEMVVDALGFTNEDRIILDEELEPPIVSLTLPINDGDVDLFSAAYLSKAALPGERLPGGVAAEIDVRVHTRRKKQTAPRDLAALCRIFEAAPQTVVERRLALGLLRAEDLVSSAAVLASFALGVAFGRWGIAQGAVAPTEATDAALLPPRPAPQLSGLRGGPDNSPRGGLGKGEILVEDKGHPWDLVSAVEDAGDRLWGEKGHERLLEIAHALTGSTTVRPWFQKTFFAHHRASYSQSRRTAPIYWQLATRSGQYSVWLYYPRMNADTFFVVQNDVLVPKLRHEEARLDEMMRQHDVGSKSATSQEISHQGSLVDELRLFLEEVRRVAPLWRPNRDDGALVNFAPLWRLIPHDSAWQKECRACWDSLCAGEFDWAHLAMRFWPERVVPKCATDRSIAVAHGLEDAFWTQNAKGKWHARSEPARSLEDLIRERTSPAVKAALVGLITAPGTPADFNRARKGRSK